MTSRPELVWGSPISVAIENWNKGEYLSEPGEHDDLPINGRKDVLIENGYGQLMPAELTVSILVQRQLNYGHIPIKQLSGFRNELSGAVITNAFSIGLVDPNEITASWTKLDSESELPSPVLLRLTGLIGYESP